MPVPFFFNFSGGPDITVNAGAGTALNATGVLTRGAIATCTESPGSGGTGSTYTASANLTLGSGDYNDGTGGGFGPEVFFSSGAYAMVYSQSDGHHRFMTESGNDDLGIPANFTTDTLKITIAETVGSGGSLSVTDTLTDLTTNTVLDTTTGTLTSTAAQTAGFTGIYDRTATFTHFSESCTQPATYFPPTQTVAQNPQLILTYTVPSAPAPVTGLTATAAPGEIDLSWTLPTDNTAAAITIQQSTDGGTTWTTVATLGPTAVSYSATGLDPSQSYSYRVGTSTGGGSGSSSTTGSTAATSPQPTSSPSAPPSPTGLTGGVDNNGYMNINWTASSGATSYKVERESLATGSWSTVGTTSGTTYQDTTYTPVGYHYRVSAVSSAGTSAPSTEYPLSRYAVIDLGANFTPASMNNNGDVVGTSISTGGIQSPFFWHEGTETSLPSFSNVGSVIPTDINDSGVITGTAFAINGADTETAVYWANSTSAPVILTDGISNPEFGNSTLQISNLNSIIGSGRSGYGTEKIDLTWASPSADPQVLNPADPMMNKIFNGVEGPQDNTSGLYSYIRFYGVMNRNGDIAGNGYQAKFVGLDSEGYPIVPAQTLLVPADNQYYNTLMTYGSQTTSNLPFTWAVSCFTDSTPYIFGGSSLNADSSSTGHIYDNTLSANQDISLGSFIPGTISTPADLTQVQLIASGPNSGTYLYEKEVPAGSPSGTTPTWITNPLGLNDLIPANSGWQINSVAKINNSGAICAQGTYSGTNSSISAGLHGLVLLPIKIVRETTPGSGDFEPITDNGLDDNAQLPIYFSDTGTHTTETDSGGYTMSAILSTDLSVTSTATVNVTYAISGGGSYTGTLTETAAGSGIFQDSGGTNILTLTPSNQTTSSTASSTLSATITIPSLSISSQPVTLLWMAPLTFQATSVEVGVMLSSALSTTTVNSITAAFYNNLTEIDPKTLTETGINTRIFKDSAGDITLTMSGFTGGTSMNVSVSATGATPSSFGATLTETSGTSLQYANYSRTFATVPDNTPATDGQAVFYVQFPGSTATSITLVSGSNSVTTTASPVTGQPGLLRTGKLVLVEPGDSFSATGFTTLQVSYPSGGGNPTTQLQMYGQTIVDPGDKPHALVASCLSRAYVVNQKDAVDYIEGDLVGASGSKASLGWAVLKKPVFTHAMLNDAVNKSSLFYIITEGVTNGGTFTDAFMGFDVINTDGFLWNTFDQIFPADIPQVPSTKNYDLVFINGCDSANNTDVYGNTGNVPAFISRFNAKAYVGWSTEVLPGSAAQGAGVFFDDLAGGQTVGQAVLQTNRDFHAGGLGPILMQMVTGGDNQVIDVTGSK